MENKISTGTAIMDWLLEGGYEKNVITTIYGPAGSGKTNLCLIAANSVKKKVIYIDTEGSFSTTRFQQISTNFKERLKQIIFLIPMNFKEQKKSFEKLKELLNDDVDLIVFDSVAMLYRLEIGQTKKVYEVNRELGIQLSILTEIARKKNIPVLITNQIYSDFENKDKVNIIGGDLLKYQSKCLIELKKTDSGLRRAIIRKHRSIEENKEVTFRICDEGLVEASEDDDDKNS